MPLWEPNFKYSVKNLFHPSPPPALQVRPPGEERERERRKRKPHPHARDSQAMPMVTKVKVHSLAELFHHVVLAADGHNLHHVTVETLYPRDVNAVLAVVTMARRDVSSSGSGRTWVLTNYDKLRDLQVAVDLLTVIKEAVLPSLITYPVAPMPLKAVKDYASQLFSTARKVGGSFFTKAQDICCSLDEYLVMAAAEIATAEEDCATSVEQPKVVEEAPQMKPVVVDDVRSLLFMPDLRGMAEQTIDQIAELLQTFVTVSTQSKK